MKPFHYEWYTSVHIQYGIPVHTWLNILAHTLYDIFHHTLSHTSALAPGGTSLLVQIQSLAPLLKTNLKLE